MTAPGATRHPVWDVYNELRTARLNIKYYTVRVEETRRLNRVLEIILAVAAPGSAVAMLFIRETSIGKIIWGPLAVVAAFVAVVKPFLKLDERLQQYEKKYNLRSEIFYKLIVGTPAEDNPDFLAWAICSKTLGSLRSWTDAMRTGITRKTSPTVPRCWNTLQRKRPIPGTE